MNPQQTRLNYVHHRMKTENLKKKVHWCEIYFVTGAFSCAKVSKQEGIQYLCQIHSGQGQ